MQTDFTTSDILRIFGFPRERFRQWMDNQFVFPTYYAKMGTRTKNIFSRWDLYGIAMFSELMELDISRDNCREFYRTWQERTETDHFGPLPLEFRKDIKALVGVKYEIDTMYPEDMRIPGKKFVVLIVLKEGAEKPYNSQVFIESLNDAWKTSPLWESSITVNMEKIIERVDGKV